MMIKSTFRIRPVSVVLAAALAASTCAATGAQEINAALKELAAAANKEGALTLSWSQSTLAGIQGAARFQTAINKMFGTNIRINFVPGPDMAPYHDRQVVVLARETWAGWLGGGSEEELLRPGAAGSLDVRRDSAEREAEAALPLFGAL